MTQPAQKLHRFAIKADDDLSAKHPSEVRDRTIGKVALLQA
jgi:hypothetical protein